ncbi:MAG TPA: SGNH/GDSL hydrolase family protein [Kiritimatiellia bacterium]|nr:SGNH/GDSL hydrolase family protein [Kiritimatiellia bacterium]HPS08100.1 SGNH/GDSL hydrolase family protein [Kiritimatiellia bacterium]
MMRGLFLIVSAALLTGMGAQPVRGEVLKDGETICFLGDSITAGGRTQTMIADYYLTRFPERTIRFVNAGRSGDSAGGSLGRLREDVIDKKPTSVTIMFGMNDVGRGYYVASPSEMQKMGQKQALDGYKANMEKVIARIRAEAGEPTLYFFTPSPFDQTVVLDRDFNQPGCNDGLGQCAAIVRELAAKNNGNVVDFHGPMTALNLERQKIDPKWTIVGGDRVHPGAPGHLMMAWLFLKAQGAPAVVSKIAVAVDASGARAAESVNAVVTAVVKTDGGVSFTVLEKALPFPVDPAAKPVLELLPIADDLNQELLSVTGLSAGRYEVKIDGMAVGMYASDELAKGINLAFNETTAQAKQARRVAQLNEQRRNAEAQACSLLNTRRWMQSHYKVSVDDPAAVQAHYDRFKDKTEYSAVMALNYIKQWSKYGELLKNVEELEKKVLAARAPVSHAYAVVPAAAGAK